LFDSDVSRIVDRLVHKALVSRVENPEERCQIIHWNY